MKPKTLENSEQVLVSVSVLTFQEKTVSVQIWVFKNLAEQVSVSVWVSKISFKTTFSGLGLVLSFHPCSQHIQKNVGSILGLSNCVCKVEQA